MKSIGRVLLAVFLWVIIASIVATIATWIIGILHGAFNTESTLGSLIFLAFTEPEIFYAHMMIVAGIGQWVLKSRKQAIAYSIIVILWSVSMIITVPNNLTQYVVTLAAIIGGIIAYGSMPAEETPKKDTESSLYIKSEL